MKNADRNITHDKYLDWQTGKTTDFPPYSPVYNLALTDLGDEEFVLLKIAVELNLPNKSKHNLDLNTLPDYFKGAVHGMKDHYSRDSYTPYLYDGVLFVTNKSIIVKFISEYKSYERKFDINDVRLELMNRWNIERITERTYLVDQKSDVYLKIGDLDLWLLEGLLLPGSNNGTYSFGRFSTYSGFMELIEYVNSRKGMVDPNEINGKTKWRELNQLTFNPIKLDKAYTLVSTILVIGAIAGFFTLFVGLIFKEEYEVAEFIIIIGIGLLAFSMILIFVLNAFGAPRFESRFQRKLISNDPRYSQFIARQ